MLETETLKLLTEALAKLDAGFTQLPAFEALTPGAERMSEILSEAAARLHNNYPYFHPLYAGQMLKPPHPVARAAYALATWINPNNHALDGGRASTPMEIEAVAEIAAMFGWQTHLGHLTGGGTMANLEALWVAGQVQPGKRIVASSQGHYTHERISAVLKLPFMKMPTDNSGHMDLNVLESEAALGDLGCVVATLGTTGVGSVDPLPEILKLRDRYGFRVHVDGAYGGYFTLADNLAAPARAAFDLVCEADSVVIDPHKHGLQPYGCGCVIFRDPKAGAFYKHDSPFTYFSSKELHLGEISMECSRPGASAVALWATQKLLPLVRGGEFAQCLSSSRRTALRFAELLRADGRFMVPFDPDLDIVVWAPRAKTASASAAESQRIFDEAAKDNLHLAMTTLPVSFFAAACPELEADTAGILCLRSVMMKPEHEQWLDEIMLRLGRAAQRTPPR